MPEISTIQLRANGLDRIPLNKSARITIMVKINTRFVPSDKKRSVIAARRGFRDTLHYTHAIAAIRKQRLDVSLVSQPFYATGSPCTSISLTSTLAGSGKGRRPVQFAQPQKIAVVELSNPATVPIVRGLL
jgi:hypothetical protein